jgi:hypothetical protein
MDQIYKLQPHRSMHLQGFDAFGAAASLWGASDTGFTVSGVWRDQADFAVLVLWISDDPFGHPRFSYLPDTNLAGLIIDFDILLHNVQPFESKKSRWTDWAYLNALLADGVTEVQVSLLSLATPPGGRTGATGTVTIAGTSAYGNRITLWYQNIAFDFTVPGGSGSQTAFFYQLTGTTASFGGKTYTVTGSPGETGGTIAGGLAALLNADVTNTTVLYGVSTNNLTWISKTNVGGYQNVGGYLLWLIADAPEVFIAKKLRDQINATNWVTNGPVVLSATASGGVITINAEPGIDGNMVTFYAQAVGGGLTVSAPVIALAGGTCDGLLWHITANLSALGMGTISKLWLTFAAPLSNAVAFTMREFSVVVTNWTITDGGGVRPLKVAGPGSVRIGETDPWVFSAGYWEWAPADGFAFWSQGRARRSAYSAYESRTLNIRTQCQSTHNIYVGTWLDSNCGIVKFTLDGGATKTIDCYGNTGKVRRLLFSAVAAGQHAVTMIFTGRKNAASSGWYFYFDFLECAVLSDVPNAPETRTDVGVATDFDTDNTYKLSPQRLIWNIQKLGLIAEIDHYCGVFWWNQRVRAGSFSFPTAVVTFAGTWANGDSAFVTIGATAIGKSVFPADDATSIAAHFTYFINEAFVGVWASAIAGVLTIKTRSTGANWLYSLVVSKSSASGTVGFTGDLTTGAAEGNWNVDPSITSPETSVLNRAFSDWHADYFASLAAASLGVVVSFSQELVNPPDNPPSAVWTQRFPDGAAVTTSTGFGSLSSSQCAFGTPMQNYMISVYEAMAGLMSAAGLPIRLQFGEVGWWFLANGSGMAFRDADTLAAAVAAGITLHTFLTPNDSAVVGGGTVSADFLRTRLKNYVAAVQAAVLAVYSTAKFELLWPMDVNDPDTCQLLRYVNLPTQWQTRSGSGFDTLVMEGFQYGGIQHNVDKATRCAAYAVAELGWDLAHCRYLMGLYYSGWPWAREFIAANPKVPLLKIWAYDHLCLFGWNLPLPRAAAASVQLLPPP